MKEIIEYLKEYDLTIEDLTQEELAQIKERFEIEKAGGFVLDGFDPMEVVWRKTKDEAKKKFDGK